MNLDERYRGTMVNTIVGNTYKASVTDGNSQYGNEDNLLIPGHSSPDDLRRMETIAAKVYKATGTGDYELLLNLPFINGELVIGDKTLEDYGIEIMTSEELLNIYNSIVGGQ